MLEKFYRTKTGLIFIVLLTLYGFYVAGRDLLSGQLNKILYVVIGLPLLWVTSSKYQKRCEQEKREEEQRAEVEARGEVKISIEGGYWTCPNCNLKNQETYDVCKDCGQLVSKD